MNYIEYRFSMLQHPFFPDEEDFGLKEWMRNMIVAGGLASTAFAPTVGHALTYDGANVFKNSPAAVWNMDKSDPRGRQDAAESMSKAFGGEASDYLNMTPRQGEVFLRDVAANDKLNGVNDDHQINNYVQSMRQANVQRLKEIKDATNQHFENRDSTGGGLGLSQKALHQMNQDNINRQLALQGNNG